MFTEIFVDYMQKHRITAYKLAKETGISQGLMNEYKNGIKMPTISNLVKIANYLDVPTDYLLGLNENPSVTTPKGDVINLQNEMENEKMKKRDAEILMFILNEGSATKDDILERFKADFAAEARFCNFIDEKYIEEEYDNYYSLTNEAKIELSNYEDETDNKDETKAILKMLVEKVSVLESNILPKTGTELR